MNEACLCTGLRRAAAFGTAQYDAALAPSGLKVTMFRLLRRIAAGEEGSISELAERLDLDRSTLGRNLRVLERQGLVEISSGDDPRARSVALTAEGRARLQLALPMWQSAQARFRALLGPETEALIARLDALDADPARPGSGARS